MGSPLYRILPDNSWKGKRCFIVGGGPSLKGFDFDLLHNELTIGINRTIEVFNPSIWFSSDKRFIRWVESGMLGGALRKKFKSYTHGLKCLVTRSENYPADILILRPSIENRLSSSMQNGIFSGRCDGCNSGLGALNLALCLGASPIYLLGFDMKGGPDGKQNWHHADYPQVESAGIYLQFIQAFEKIAKQANKKARIVNLNPDSALRCFPFENIDKIIPSRANQFTRDIAGCIIQTTTSGPTPKRRR
jgi:hypothetical protein